MNKPASVEASLHSAMAAAFSEIEAATKSSANPAFKQGGKVSKYADIRAIIDAIKPALIKHDLYFTQRPEPTERGITVETVLGHAGGEELSLGKLFVPANKNDPQGFGSALTYARRYALVTAFGVPTEDDDGNAATAAMRGGGTGTKQEDCTVSPAAPISDADWAKIVSLCKATNTEAPEVKAHIGAANLKVLAPEQLEAAFAYLESKLAKMAKAETNAKAKEDA